MTIVNIKDFNKVASKIDRTKYHLSVEIIYGRTGCTNYSNIYVSKYSLYRGDMPLEEYFSPENKAILSTSQGNDFEDLKEWVKENCE